MEDIKICSIPVPREQCEDLRKKCCECEYCNSCDCYWISELWQAENKKFKANSLLGPYNPAFFKPDMRNNHVISVTGKYDFCCFNVPKTKDVIVVGDIYVDDAVRGQGISKKILSYLMEKYDRDIFAKCVRGTSAEQFWQHLGVQVDANIEKPLPHDFYEHRPGKRDLGWYRVINKNKKSEKIDLF